MPAAPAANGWQQRAQGGFAAPQPQRAQGGFAAPQRQQTQPPQQVQQGGSGAWHNYGGRWQQAPGYGQQQQGQWRQPQGYGQQAQGQWQQRQPSGPQGQGGWRGAQGNGQQPQGQWQGGRGYRGQQGQWQGGQQGQWQGARGGDGGARWDHGWRQDRRYDWRDWRDENRDAFHVGRYFPPYRDWYYQRLAIGALLDPGFYAQDYWVDDPGDYHLPPAYGPYQWVRYYNDALLVNVYDGEVVDVIYDFFW
ncbi:MAG: RcnB family protein [Sphingomonadales bacterium]|nr:RcnB family protein [Sphingomonadales bacterium]